jgi:hypothetical protein
MATGIVSVVARTTRHAAVSTVLAVTASVALGVLVLWSTIGVATTGTAAGQDPLARALLLFGPAVRSAGDRAVAAGR